MPYNPDIIVKYDDLCKLDIEKLEQDARLFCVISALNSSPIDFDGTRIVIIGVEFSSDNRFVRDFFDKHKVYYKTEY